MSLDPYEQLGVARGATADEIKSAWRSKAQSMHPDKHPGDPYAETRFAQIRESYDILSDAARRSAYDGTGSTERNNLPERARSFLSTLALGVLNEAQTSGQIGELNLVQSLRHGIAQITRNHATEGAMVERTIRGLEKQLKRVRRKSKGNNLLGDLIAVRLDEVRKRKQVLAAASEECDAALALLNDYEDLDLKTMSLPSVRIFT